ncbi:MAG: thiamine pyrophosphate-dependent enzyme [Actinomycetota bacterium]
MSKTFSRRDPITDPISLDRLGLSHDEVIADYRLAFASRVASLIGRKEVLTGKAKFGIFGDGKEIAQLAMAKAFRPGDWRSGYYRDQTFMLAAQMLTFEEFFGQLYADTDLVADPASGGRQMGSHFASRFLDDQGLFLRQVELKNCAADMSPTASQMARLLGLAYASKLYRNNPSLSSAADGFSVNGNEIAFGTIGNASTSEGVFFETINAAGVLQVPMLISVWDDGYGISVPNSLQTVKASISKALAGMKTDADGGLDIHVVKGWDYLGLIETYASVAHKMREDHVPALIHVIEMTQPLGHSTSGSHERYKSAERLTFEEEFDPIRLMRQWIISEQIATSEELDQWEIEEKQGVEAIRKKAWNTYIDPIKAERDEVLALLPSGLDAIAEELANPLELNRRLIQSSLVRAVFATRDPALADYLSKYKQRNNDRFNSHLYSRSIESPLQVKSDPATYSANSEVVDGRIVLQRCFDHQFEHDPRSFVIGEDVGKLGDVNLVFEGLNEKYGDLRVTDTGIREATILGQGIGAAMRGLRPIVDIQYLDYLLYALQICSDDLANLHYRTAGGQKAPVIIRTKGHRLQGIWHTGSPMGVVLHACRGVYLAVPRNMTQAAGMYNTLLRSDNPAILIEVLNGYRIKETVPDNVGTFTVALGVPELLRKGADLTIVTYGACCRIALDAAGDLEAMGIDVEVIDVQTLNPFDIGHTLVESVKKTNAVVFLDEDVPGGASAFMMQQVLEVQAGWQFLDTGPRTLSAKENRSAYASDGEYFTKPNREDVVEAVYAILSERRPKDFPKF